MKHQHNKNYRGFSLVELILVVPIAALLLAILVPILSKVDSPRKTWNESTFEVTRDDKTWVVKGEQFSIYFNPPTAILSIGDETIYITDNFSYKKIQPNIEQ